MQSHDFEILVGDVNYMCAALVLSHQMSLVKLQERGAAEAQQAQLGLPDA